MDYEKKYKEALERARQFSEKPYLEDSKGIVDYIFPELKESEDERIRKEMISWLKGFIGEEEGCGYTEDEIRERIAWLEKQGKQKSADKVEPMFHEGDWIIHHGTENIYQVVAVIDNQYQLKYGDTYTIQKCADVDRCARLWDITNDAKGGDVLVDEDNNIGIYRGGKDDLYWNSRIYLGCDNRLRGFSIGGRHKHENTKPATKEQRDLLFQKMYEAGYEWNADTKKLKKIEQNPAWSEEDEENLNWFEKFFRAESVIAKGKDVPQDKYLWFKNLKDRVLPQQKQEWSEEDEKMYARIVRSYTSYEGRILYATGLSEDNRNNILEDLNEQELWLKYRLKSLRPQNTWKPSEEQINTLWDAIVYVEGCNSNFKGSGSVLEKLYNDLKKLREE